MRFLIQLSVFATLLAVPGTNSFAQRGSTGGGHVSISPGRGMSRSSGYPGALGLRSPAAGYTGIRPGALRSRGNGDYRHVPYPYFFTPYYYPFLDYSSAPYGGAPYDVPDDPGAEAAIMAQNSLGEQIQRLSAEVAQLAQNQQAQQTPSYPQYSQPDPPAAPVMLVLHNGQTLQVQNYAIMDQTFWDFTRQPARKIPISNIDVAASTKATQARGGEFPQLDSGQ